MGHAVNNELGSDQREDEACHVDHKCSVVVVDWSVDDLIKRAMDDAERQQLAESAELVHLGLVESHCDIAEGIGHHTDGSHDSEDMVELERLNNGRDVSIRQKDLEWLN